MVPAELRAVDIPFASQAAIEPTPTAIESLPELLQRLATTGEPSWIVEGLIPDGISMIHAQPREYKSLIAQSLLVSLATGTPAFGLERLAVGDPAPALYVTEEDSARRVAQRFEQFLAGANLMVPDCLHVAATKGINLDIPEHQDGLIAQTKRHGYRLVTLDPVRSLTACADQGPRELKPFTDFLRRFLRETGAALLLVHHDTKPQNLPDNRRRPQRASGGGIFSICDNPIAVDPVDTVSRLLNPTAFKFCEDPAPIVVRLEHGAGWLRLTGSETSGTAGTDAALDLRILDYLQHSPFAFGSNIAKGAHARKSEVLQRLEVLLKDGKVDSLQERRGTKWMLRREL